MQPVVVLNSFKALEAARARLIALFLAASEGSEVEEAACCASSTSPQRFLQEPYVCSTSLADLSLLTLLKYVRLPPFVVADCSVVPTQSQLYQQA